MTTLTQGWLHGWFTCPWCGAKQMSVWQVGTKMLECIECHKMAAVPEAQAEDGGA